jgi:hypothetical protein
MINWEAYRIKRLSPDSGILLQFPGGIEEYTENLRQDIGQGPDSRILNLPHKKVGALLFLLILH